MRKKSQKKIGNKSAENFTIFRHLWTTGTNQERGSRKNKDKLHTESSC